MGSMYSKIRQDQTLGSANIARLCDFDETDPYYFVVKEGNKIIGEGELPMVKLKIDESYLYKPIKRVDRDRITMIATLQY